MSRRRDEPARKRSSHDPGELPFRPATWTIAEARRFVDVNRRTLVTPIQRELDDHHGEAAQLPWRALLIALVILGLQRSNTMQMRTAWQILMRLPPKTQRQLRVVQDGHVVTYAQVTHLFRRVEKIVRALNDIDHVDEPAFAAWFVEALLAHSVDESLLTSNIAVDSTDLRSWGKTTYDEESVGKPRKKGDPPIGRTPTEPDAGRGHMSAHNDMSAGWFSGYDVHLFVTTRDDTSSKVPLLIESMAMTSAGVNKGASVLPALRRLHARRPVDTVYADRGYSMHTWDNWAHHLAEIGVRHCIDLSENQHNDTESIYGAIRIDGWLFSPSLPPELRRLPKICSGMPYVDKIEIAKLYDERAKYAFRIHGRPDSMTLRLEPPCHAGALRCAQVSLTLRRPSSKYLTVNAPEHPNDHLCCNQQTITVPLQIFKGTEQRYLYGTTEWVNKYYRRVAVESANSLLKLHYASMTRGIVRYRRGTAVALLIGILCCAMNILTRRAWNRDHDIPEQYPDVATEPAKPGHAAPRKRRGRRKPNRTALTPT